MLIKVIRACDTRAEPRMRTRKRPPSLLHSHCSKAVKNTSLAPKAFSFFTNNRHFCETEILIRQEFILLPVQYKNVLSQNRSHEIAMLHLLRKLTT